MQLQVFRVDWDPISELKSHGGSLPSKKTRDGGATGWKGTMGLRDLINQRAGGVSVVTAFRSVLKLISHNSLTRDIEARVQVFKIRNLNHVNLGWLLGPVLTQLTIPANIILRHAVS